MVVHYLSHLRRISNILQAVGRSSADIAIADTVVGHKLGLMRTASFEGTASGGFPASAINILTASYDSANNTIGYKFDKDEFVTATGIYDSDSDITNAVPSNRYALDTDGVFTGSNAANADTFVASYTVADKNYIAKTAEDLPNASAGDRFITGAFFSDITNMVNTANNVVSNANIGQGVVEFRSGSTYSFGATASLMDPASSPQFTNLTASGDLLVQGTLTTVDTTNLMVKDQFILINSGAKSVGQDSINDEDGGIVVDGGGGSGSLFMFDASTKAWGIIGAGAANTQFNATGSSQAAGTNVVPQVFVRTIRYSYQEENYGGTPPAGADLKYGDSTANTQEGSMFVDVTSDDVYVYA